MSFTAVLYTIRVNTSASSLRTPTRELLERQRVTEKKKKMKKKKKRAAGDGKRKRGEKIKPWGLKHFGNN